MVGISDPTEGWTLRDGGALAVCDAIRTVKVGRVIVVSWSEDGDGAGDVSGIGHASTDEVLRCRYSGA